MNKSCARVVGCGLRVARWALRGIGYSILDARCSILDAGYSILDTKRLLSAALFWIAESDWKSPNRI